MFLVYSRFGEDVYPFTSVQLAQHKLQTSLIYTLSADDGDNFSHPEEGCAEVVRKTYLRGTHSPPEIPEVQMSPGQYCCNTSAVSYDKNWRDKHCMAREM
ncbi:hypothetical protein RvY_07542 [Ramazzottius varieornatus]|uniref:Uncharacterized protein n=1 Tax=Ramazzottius varieornatus TaxID=947166 RepID=A0A1D1V2J9_RAMVA|nr:hypothetical protein RvY_07542 [Ramazzottius varieornatus]